MDANSAGLGTSPANSAITASIGSNSRRGRRGEAHADQRRSPDSGCGSRGEGAFVRQPSTRRRIVTAFWPPNPKPWTATVSTFALRAVSGT